MSVYIDLTDILVQTKPERETAIQRQRETAIQRQRDSHRAKERESHTEKEREPYRERDSIKKGLPLYLTVTYMRR